LFLPATAKPKRVKQPFNLDSVSADTCDKASVTQLVTFHFNPMKFDHLRDTYRRWLPTLGPLADRLICYELVFDDDEPEIPGSTVLRGTREHNLLWQKEAIVNLALANCSPEIEYFAWLDHDLVIQKPDWLADAIGQIDAGAAAVQVIGELSFLDKFDVPSAFRTAAIKRMKSTSNLVEGSPGGAWIADRRWMDSIGGLYAGNITGGGDQAFIDTFEAQTSGYLKRYSKALKAEVLAYVSRARGLLAGRTVGYVDTDVFHIWHGDRSDRQYTSRDKMLVVHAFDPATDITIEPSGLLRWCSDKPELRRRLAEYFAGRREDG
jgi:hypothetical protein